MGLLIATLATIGVFPRMRTASLAEASARANESPRDLLPIDAQKMRGQAAAAEQHHLTQRRAGGAEDAARCDRHLDAIQYFFSFYNNRICC